MKFGVVVFPGSNCDADCYHVIDQVLEHPVTYIWHQEKKLSGVDCVIIPGGFSYGDYLRTGAIARFAPVMDEVIRFAERGGLILGICNGFQILLEAGLLPGAVLRNESLQFRCHDVFLRVENAVTPFTNRYRQGEVIRFPIAHGEGNYYADPDSIKQMDENGQIVFRYCLENGESAAQANPNGAVGNIAGVCNKNGNIMGLMPHPERCCEEILGNTDGILLFSSLLQWWGFPDQKRVTA